MTEEGEKEIVLDPFDSINIPIGVYRGFRYDGEAGTLLTIIGGPEAGKAIGTRRVEAVAFRIWRTRMKWGTDDLEIDQR